MDSSQHHLIQQQRDLFQQQQQQHARAYSSSTVSEPEPKHCWVCFAGEDDDYSAQWVSPCKCKGTAKWVHKSCLQRWIDEKQQGNSSIEVSCPQCNSGYIIVYPRSGLVVRMLDILDRIINKSCPFLAGGILVGSVYWSAVTYGAVTIMQVLGHKEGLNVMEKSDPLIMLIGLPAIPVMLMLGRLIRWEDALLKFWRKHSTKLPLFNLILPNSNQYLPRTPAVAYASNSDPVSFTRTICGGLILPTIATIVGKLLFQRINSNFQRSIIGGIAFIGLKGIVKIYYKQQQFLRQAHRQIKNYEHHMQQQHQHHNSPSNSPSSASHHNQHQQSHQNQQQQQNNRHVPYHMNFLNQQRSPPPENPTLLLPTTTDNNTTVDHSSNLLLLADQPSSTSSTTSSLDGSQ